MTSRGVVFGVAVMAICCSAGFAEAISFGVPGTNLSVHIGEGGDAVQQHGPVFQSPGEILGTAVAGGLCGPVCATAFDHMSPEDKQNAVAAITTGGIVVIGVADPALGLAITLLTDKDQSGGHPVTVAQQPKAFTGNVWDINTDCIAQKPDGQVVAYSKAEYPHHGEVKRGDKVRLSAPLCPAANQDPIKSVSTVEILVTGLTTDDAASAGDFKYYITGGPA
ncbi:hypothetical protein ACU8OR_30060 (plasmid) [Rhizobium leguminosarum]